MDRTSGSTWCYFGYVDWKYRGTARRLLSLSRQVLIKEDRSKVEVKPEGFGNSIDVEDEGQGEFGGRLNF